MNLRTMTGDTEIWYRHHRIDRFPNIQDEYWEEVVDHVIRGGVRVQIIEEDDDRWDGEEWD